MWLVEYNFIYNWGCVCSLVDGQWWLVYQALYGMLMDHLHNTNLFSSVNCVRFLAYFSHWILPKDFKRDGDDIIGANVTTKPDSSKESCEYDEI